MIGKLVVAAAVLLLSVLGAAPAAAAEPPTVQELIDSVLAQHPGGEQISETAVSWSDGAVVLSFVSPLSRAVGTCATGSYCAWKGTNYSGTKLSFTGCSAGGTENGLALLGGIVGSLANARTSGTVRAANGGSTVYLISPNSGIPANTSTLTKLVCAT